MTALAQPDQLVVAISSRALFDFEEENAVFESADDRAYMQMQLERLEQPAKPGVAYRLVKKLLAFNADQARRVEVVILSRNDPVSGLRVFRSVQGARLGIERGVFTRGRSPFSYLQPLKANLFLSANGEDVRAALTAGFPAALVYTQTARDDSHPDEVRIAFDGDAVLFADEAERVFQPAGARRVSDARGRSRDAAAAAGPVQAAARSAAPAAACRRERRGANEASHGARHGAQRARARARDPHADGLEDQRRRGDVPRRPREGAVPARVRAGFLLRRPDAARRVGVAARSGRATCRTASPTNEPCYPA